MSGSSFLQGPHQVAKKLRRIGLPIVNSSLRKNLRPARVVRKKLGAWSPTFMVPSAENPMDKIKKRIDIYFMQKCVTPQIYTSSRKQTTSEGLDGYSDLLSNINLSI